MSCIIYLEAVFKEFQSFFVRIKSMVGGKWIRAVSGEFGRDFCSLSSVWLEDLDLDLDGGVSWRDGNEENGRSNGDDVDDAVLDAIVGKDPVGFVVCVCVEGG